MGLIIDYNLRFKEHVSQCIRRSYISLKMLYPHRKLLSETLKIKLAEVLVLSHFNYCDVIYGPCLEKIDINRIEKLQKSCLRFIYGIRKYDPISHKLKEAKWLNMENRRKMHSLVLFHGVISKKCPPYLVNKIKFRTDVHNLNLRFKGLITPPPHKTALFTRCFSFNISKLYNCLPAEMINLQSAAFKNKLKKHFLDSSLPS